MRRRFYGVTGAALLGLCLWATLFASPAWARAGRLAVLAAPGLTAHDVLGAESPFEAFSQSATVGLLPPGTVLSSLASVSALRPAACRHAPHLSLASTASNTLAGRLWGLTLSQSEGFLTNQAVLQKNCSPALGELAGGLAQVGIESALVADTTCLSPHPAAALLAARPNGFLPWVRTTGDFTRADGTAACGRRLDTARFAAVVWTALSRRAFVVAEVGTLSRLAQESPFVSAARRPFLRRSALGELALLVQRLHQDTGESADLLVMGLGGPGEPGVLLGLGPDFPKGGLMSGPKTGVVLPASVGGLVGSLFTLSPPAGVAAPGLKKPQGVAAFDTLRNLQHHDTRRRALEKSMPQPLVAALALGLLLMWLLSHVSYGAPGASALGNLGALVLIWPVSLWVFSPLGFAWGALPWAGLAFSGALLLLLAALWLGRRLSVALLAAGFLSLLLGLVDGFSGEVLSRFSFLPGPDGAWARTDMHPFLCGLALGGMVTAAAWEGGAAPGRSKAVAWAGGGLGLLMLLAMGLGPLGAQPVAATLGVGVLLALLLAHSHRAGSGGEWLVVSLVGGALAFLAGQEALMKGGYLNENLSALLRWPGLMAPLATGVALLSLVRRPTDWARLKQLHPTLSAGVVASLLGALLGLWLVPGGGWLVMGWIPLPLAALLSALWAMPRRSAAG